METNKKLIEEFLSKKNIAVTGVSRNEKTGLGNAMIKKFKVGGFTTFSVNPNADEIGGEKCYRNIKSIPEKIDAVFIANKPEHSLSIVKECREAGIDRVWFHRLASPGSGSPEAEKFCRENGIKVITHGCPMMFIGPVDFFHKCTKFILSVSGRFK